MNNSMVKKRMSARTQALSTIAAVVAAVALPQIFHTLGAATGMGSALGEMFLPMHLPVLLVGFLAGPLAGLLAGAFSPLVSYSLTGMPGLVMLPFMVIELAAYGVFAGLMREVRLPSLFKVIIVQLAGRAVRAAAILLAVYGLGNTAVKIPVIWNSIVTGLPGLALQWLLVPLILLWAAKRRGSHA